MHTQPLTKLSRVYERYAPMIRRQAEQGLPYATLVSNRDAMDKVYFHRTLEKAREFTEGLKSKGINAAFAKTDSTAANPLLGYKLYVTSSVMRPSI